MVAVCLPGTIQTVRERSEAEDRHAVSRRGFLAGGAAAAAASALAHPARAASFATSRRGRRTQDLTHVFRAGFPVYTFDPPTRRTLVTVENDGFYSQEWTFGEHSGTHMDVPGHFIADGRRAPQIRARELLIPVVVIDISDKAASDPDAVVTVRDIRRFERRHGRIPARAGVFMDSGWAARVDDPESFKNADENGTYHFPGFGLEAVEFLLTERDITCIGVDTLSLDHGPSTTFAVHLEILGANRYGLENLANLSKIPPRGAHAFVGLIPWEEGSGGPCRVIATY